MDMIADVKRSQMVLLSGLLILAVATAGSLFGVSRLEDAFGNRRDGLTAQDSYDELSKKVKDWALGSRDPAFDEVEAKKALNVAIKRVEFRVNGNSVRSGIFENIKGDLNELNEKSSPPTKETLSKIDVALEELNAIEFASIEHHNRTVLAYINRIMAISIAAMVLAFLLIGASLRARSREEKSKSKMIERLKLLKEQADSASKLKSKFLSTVSHEIRTPLNGIIGLSDALANSPQGVNQQNFSRMIHQSGKTLLRIINDILDFSKIEAGKFELSAMDCSLAEIADQVLFILSPKAAEKKINLSYEIDHTLPSLVKSDPDRISQVLFNLVGNAIKFTAVGSVILRIKSQKLETGDLSVQFSVVDSGIGIPEKDLTNLFAPFMQVHQAGTAGEPGTGLGLSISQSIVNAMGSKIEVKSDEARGSQFSFSLIFKDFSSEMVGKRTQFLISEEMASQAKIEPLVIDAYRPKVLVVEDNTTNQVVAQTMLQRLGINHQIASDGEEAIKMIGANDFDLVFMDCQMPGLDGIDTTKALRKIGNRIPIVAMTANAYGEDERECREAGMDGFLTKPLSIEDLRQQLASHLPARKAFSRDVLFSLDSSVGPEGRKKVVRSFLSASAFFKETLSQSIAKKDLAELKRLGHRYKSSSLSVGGLKFSEVNRSLEELSSLNTVAELELEAKQSLAELENYLREYA